MEELHAEHSARQAEIAAVEADAEEAAKVRRHAEGASQDAEESLKHFQQQVSRVRTQREYSALLQEIDTVKSQIKALEEEALGALERFDGAQTALTEQRAAFADLDQRYTDAQSKWEGRSLKSSILRSNFVGSSRIYGRVCLDRLVPFFKGSTSDATVTQRQL